MLIVASLPNVGQSKMGPAEGRLMKSAEGMVRKWFENRERVNTSEGERTASDRESVVQRNE